jgi:4-diphosphocytidyl-2-C-methyl-D-erythritol kinase
MCLPSRPAVVSGVGDVIDRVIIVPEMFVVLVNPGFPVATPDVFRAYSGAALHHPESPPFEFAAGDRDGFIAALTSRRNDLEAAALSLHPDISRVLAYLRASEGCMLARMSGSGATCFGLFAGADDAERAADSIRASEPAWWSVSAPLDWREESRE